MNVRARLPDWQARVYKQVLEVLESVEEWLQLRRACLLKLGRDDEVVACTVPAVPGHLESE
jgi:hypothetical protein